MYAQVKMLWRLKQKLIGMIWLSVYMMNNQTPVCFFLFYSPDILLSCFLVAVYVIILI